MVTSNNIRSQSLPAVQALLTDAERLHSLNLKTIKTQNSSLSGYLSDGGEQPGTSLRRSRSEPFFIGVAGGSLVAGSPPEGHSRAKHRQNSRLVK